MLKRLFAPWDLPAKGNPAFERIAYVYVIPLGITLIGAAFSWPKMSEPTLALGLGLMFYFAIKTRTWG